MRAILYGLFALSLSVNLYFTYQVYFKGIPTALQSDIPYKNDPVKLIEYLDGYYAGVKAEYGKFRLSPVIDYIVYPNPYPANIYGEGMKNGVKDSEDKAAQAIEESKEGIRFLRSAYDMCLQRLDEQHEVNESLHIKYMQKKQ